MIDYKCPRAVAALRSKKQTFVRFWEMIEIDVTFPQKYGPKVLEIVCAILHIENLLPI